MTPAATSMPCFSARPLHGAMRPYRPIGMAMLIPVGIACHEFGGIVVCQIAKMSYPTKLGVACRGRNWIGFVLSVNLMGTMYVW